MKTNWRPWSTWVSYRSLVPLAPYSQDADADGSGSVDFGEFVEMLIKVTRRLEVDPEQASVQREAEKETPEDLKQAFRVFDKVGLGFVFNLFT